jgi:DNA-binding NarL/FixJ family response regulator
MKVLIVSRNQVWTDEFAEALREEKPGTEVYASSHENALARFLAEEPDIVLISEYYEKNDISEENWPGRQTFADIKRSATEEQVILRCGFIPLSHDDFLQLPFTAEAVLGRL